MRRVLGGLCISAVCAGLVAGQDAALKAAVVKCVEEDPTGGCACAGTSCSADARFQGSIGTWDVSGVKDMDKLFYTANSAACTIYCDFNGDISVWDTSSVTTMHGMYVWRLPLVLMLGQAYAPMPTQPGRFYFATSFNQDISKWDTSNVAEMLYM